MWQAHGLDAILRDAHAAGTVLCGVSAGSLCWVAAGVTDSFGPELAPLRDGLGLVGGSNCPHYDGEPQRRPTYHRLIAAGQLPAGLAADDGCGLHFVDGRLRAAVSSRPTGGAYRVERVDGAVVETPLDVARLGPGSCDSRLARAASPDVSR